MKHVLKTITLALTCAVATPVMCYAQSDSRSGLGLGLDYEMTHFNTHKYYSFLSLYTPAVSHGAKVTLNYRFNKYFGVSVGHKQHFPSHEDNRHFKMSGLGGEMMGYLPFGDNSFELIGVIGTTTYHFDVETRGVTPSHSERVKTHVVKLGIGGAYHFDDHWSARLMVDREESKLTGNRWTQSLGVQYTF